MGNPNQDERITWLRYEFAEAIEQFEHKQINARRLADHAASLVSKDELDMLGDELLQHSYWAMNHVLHRPACWAASPEELAYLRRCLRDEDLFDSSKLEYPVESG